MWRKRAPCILRAELRGSNAMTSMSPMVCALCDRRQLSSRDMLHMQSPKGMKGRASAGPGTTRCSCSLFTIKCVAIVTEERVCMYNQPTCIRTKVDCSSCYSGLLTFVA
eukprot:TRINITY_DN1831_c0_g2_i3.p3 TRINITY_DN1831_c0_g2~~TRINITY_DN1831_c0_g2_i3.p3  ORF type:complete len:109 (-),score=6.28 TRINITY_DN1831_c0_g2_i3:622-948(-)